MLWRMNIVCGKGALLVVGSGRHCATRNAGAAVVRLQGAGLISRVEWRDGWTEQEKERESERR